MGAGHYLDLDTWPRRPQFEFFRAYEQPFFQVCAPVRVSSTRARCQEQGSSFSLACWFLCVRAANDVAPFRYRLRGDRVWVHDRITVATTVLREDESFAFCHLPAADRFTDFEAAGGQAMDHARAHSGKMDDRPERDDLLHGSTLPWLSFTSITNARRAPVADSVPKIIFGRFAQDHSGELMMPVAVEVHHALMDGLHVARFFQRLESLLARPEAELG